MSNFLNRDQILSVDDLKREIVEVPEWGGSVWVRSLTGAERDKYESTLYKTKGTNVEISLKDVRALLVSMSIVDEDGKNLFSYADVQVLSKKNAAALDRVAEVASKLSGLSAKDQQALTNDLPNDQSDNSGSF